MMEDYCNLNYNYTTYEQFLFFKIENALPPVLSGIAWIVISIGLPLTLLAIYALFSLVRDDHVVPVYVMNLLVSDLLQICYLVIWVATPKEWCRVILVSKSIYFISVTASVGFMVCVALERYLVVAYPLWYRFRRSIKRSVLFSIMVWALCFIEFLFALLTPNFFHTLIFLAFILLPFPLLIFCLVGTLKALSAAISVRLKEKRRIVASLVVVLINYTVLFLPWIVWLLEFSFVVRESGFYVSFLHFSPLADLVLYVFMRKGVVDKLLARLCCCRMTREVEQQQEQNINEKNTEEACSVNTEEDGKEGEKGEQN